jgi:transposase InsO family protein
MATKGTSKEHRLSFRLQMVRYAHEHQIKPTVAKFGMARNTLKKWLRRYEKEGVKGLLDKRNGPKNIKHKTPEHIEQQVIAIREHAPCYGAKRIKYFFNLPCGQGAIQRIIKQHGLTRKRRKVYQKKQDLRDVKAAYNAFTHLQFDLKHLRDIPHYWTQMQLYDLPKFQYTVRDTKSGWVFLGYSNELSELNARVMIDYVITFMKASIPISVETILVQTDNGAEFSGAGRRVKTASFVRALTEDLGVQHAYIPPGCCNANADVESFHNTIEEEFFDLTTVQSREDFMRNAETYRVWYNLVRPNFSKKNCTPLDIVDIEYPDESAQGKLICISTIDLDRIDKISTEMRGGQSLPDFPDQINLKLISKPLQ